ncbi:MAG: nuclear transport factor 2 family protein [Actinomycetota bacterium]
MLDGPSTVRSFNENINARNIEGLASLMSDDHVFIDTAGGSVTGKRACLEAWRGFFNAYPRYRNSFESVQAKDGVVTIIGHSECPGVPILEGTALWTAMVSGNRVAQWRVHEDTAEARERLGLT